MAYNDVSLRTEDQKLARMRSLAICIYFATYYRYDVNKDSEQLY